MSLSESPTIPSAARKSRIIMKSVLRCQSHKMISTVLRSGKDFLHSFTDNQYSFSDFLSFESSLDEL